MVGIYWIYPLEKGSLGVKQLGYHFKGTSIFPITYKSKVFIRTQNHHIDKIRKFVNNLLHELRRSVTYPHILKPADQCVKPNVYNLT